MLKPSAPAASSLRACVSKQQESSQQKFENAANLKISRHREKDVFNKKNQTRIQLKNWDLHVFK